jgi:hypothetical protein
MSSITVKHNKSKRKSMSAAQDPWDNEFPNTLEMTSDEELVALEFAEADKNSGHLDKSFELQAMVRRSRAAKKLRLSRIEKKKSKNHVVTDTAAQDSSKCLHAVREVKVDDEFLGRLDTLSTALIAVRNSLAAGIIAFQEAGKMEQALTMTHFAAVDGTPEIVQSSKLLFDLLKSVRQPTSIAKSAV